MADPFQLDDEDTDEYAAAFPRLGRRQRMPETPHEPAVDPALLDWANREKTINAEHAAARRVDR